MKSRLARALVCVGCLYHVGAMITINVPTSTAFESELRAPFKHYVGYLGLWQNWTMFHTIPSFRALRPMLVARYDGGAESVHGAMLPELGRYPHRTRLASLFLRYQFPSADIEPYRRAYLKRACGVVSKKSGRKPRTVTMRLDAIQLHSLAEARTSGVVGKRISELSSSSVACP